MHPAEVEGIDKASKVSTHRCPLHPWHLLHWDASGFLVCLPPQVVKPAPLDEDDEETLSLARLVRCQSRAAGLRGV